MIKYIGKPMSPVIKNLNDQNQKETPKMLADVFPENTKDLTPGAIANTDIKSLAINMTEKQKGQTPNPQKK
ncbi:hypothetical protein N7528_004493 [Penicillium herquei]|nr:hypothetical protein N7528_004493 [Penicillium herquei]